MEKLSSQGMIKDVTKFDQGMIETRDQDSVGFCYAYSGADIYESWLRRKGLIGQGQHVSALALSVDYFKDDFAQNVESNATGLKTIKEPYLKAKKKHRDMLDKYIDSSNLLWDFREDFILNNNLQNLEPEEVDKALKMDDGYKVLYVKNELNYSKFAKAKKEFEDLHKRFESYKFSVPEGGRTSLLLESLNPNVCLEAEVPSNDNVLRNLIEKDYSSLTELKDMSDYLLQLSYSYLSNDDMCVAFEVAKNLFPSPLTNNYADLENILKLAPSISSLYQRLLLESCQRLRVDFKPSIINKRNDSKSSNQEAIALINRAIKEKKPVEVSYKGNIFKKMGVDVATDTSNHSSLVVGELSFCDDKFYVVRNSWGKNACKDYQSSYGPPQKWEEVKDLDRQRGICEQQVNLKQDPIYKNCKSDSVCIQMAVNAYQEEYSKCEEEYNLKIKKLLSVPYFCDEQGNFIIKKKSLDEVIYGATYISN